KGTLRWAVETFQRARGARECPIRDPESAAETTIVSRDAGLGGGSEFGASDCRSECHGPERIDCHRFLRALAGWQMGGSIAFEGWERRGLGGSLRSGNRKADA